MHLPLRFLVAPMRAKAAQNLLKQLVHYPFEMSIQSASDIQFSMTSYYLPLNKVFNAYKHTKSVNVDNVTSQPTHHNAENNSLPFSCTSFWRFF